MKHTCLTRCIIMLSIICISHAVQGDEKEFKRLAYFREFKGPVDFIRNVEERPLRLFKGSWSMGWVDRNVSFYDWDNKTKQYVMTEQANMPDETLRSNYEDKGLLFSKGLHRESGYAYPPYLNALAIKQLRTDTRINKQEYNIYVTIRTTDTYIENAALSIYKNHKCIYEDILVASSCDMHICEAIVCDVNQDSFPEILIGILDLGQETSKLFIYGFKDNPWISQEYK